MIELGQELVIHLRKQLFNLTQFWERRKPDKANKFQSYVPKAALFVFLIVFAVESASVIVSLSSLLSLSIFVYVFLFVFVSVSCTFGPLFVSRTVAVCTDCSCQISSGTFNCGRRGAETLRGR